MDTLNFFELQLTKSGAIYQKPQIPGSQYLHPSAPGISHLLSVKRVALLQSPPPQPRGAEARSASAESGRWKFGGGWSSRRRWMGGRVEVPEQLTAQGDHQVAQQQQEEAVAAPPRHLPGAGASCSARRSRVPAAGARETGEGPELLGLPRRRESRSRGSGGEGRVLKGCQFLFPGRLLRRLPTGRSSIV